MRFAAILFVFLSTFAVAESLVKPSELRPITNGQVATDDLLLLFDTSAGLTKKIRVSELDTRWSGGGGGGDSDAITSLTGQVTASGPGAATATITNSAVIGKLLTGFSSGAGTVAATDTILEAFNKFAGNIALLAPLSNATFSGTTTIATLNISGLTASTVPYLNSSKNLASSSVTPTELGWLSGVSSALQTQIDGKSPTAGNASLVTVGTVSSGTWSATAIALNKGGTGQTTKSPAFDALQPMSASGDLIYGGASGTGTRLAKGSDGQVLTLASGIPSWSGGISVFVTHAYFAATSSCEWDKVSSSFSAFPTVSACPGPTVDISGSGPWTVSTSDTNLPQITISSLPAGVVTVKATGVGVFTSGITDGAAQFAINDGTSTSGFGLLAGVNGVGLPFETTGTFSYSSAGDRTFKLFVMGDGTHNIRVHNSSDGAQLHFYVTLHSNY